MGRSSPLPTVVLSGSTAGPRTSGVATTRHQRASGRRCRMPHRRAAADPLGRTRPRSAAAGPTCGSAAAGTGIDPAGRHRRPDRGRSTPCAPRTAEYTLLLNAPDWLGRRGVGEALRDAVAELRAIDLTYGPNRPDSLVSRLRRGEISPDSYPPLADLVDRCAAMRAATDGWFDAWAVPGGFDPGGLLGGWAVERAARAAARRRHPRLRRAQRRRPGRPRPRRRTAGRGGSRCTTRPTPERAPLVLEMTAGAVGTSG